MSHLADGVELGTTTASGATDIAGLSRSAGMVHATDWFTVGASAPVADFFEYAILNASRQLISREIGYMSANAAGVVNIKRHRCIYDYSGGTGALLLNNPTLPTLANGTQYYITITASVTGNPAGPSDVRSGAKRIIGNAAISHYTGGSTKTLAANRVYSNRFLLRPCSMPILGCGFGFGSAGTLATKARVALHQLNADGKLGRLMFETADITGFGTSGSKEAVWGTTGRILPAGEYVISIIADLALVVLTNSGDARGFDYGPNSLGFTYAGNVPYPQCNTQTTGTYAAWTSFAGIALVEADMNWQYATQDTPVIMYLMG